MTTDTPSPLSPDGKRRRHLLWGTAAAAAAAGTGLASWQTTGRAPAAAGGPEALLWSQQFETPGGQPLALQSLWGKPLLVNFWATWCPPCIEELPLLNAFYRENTAKGFQVLGLAIDQPSAVRNFLHKTPLDFPVALAGFGGTELGKALGNITGALPFTVVLGAQGTVLHRKMGKVTPDELAQWRQLT